MFGASHALAPAVWGLVGLSTLLAAVLAGVFLGLRISERDSASLATARRESAAAVQGARDAHARCDAMEEAWSLQVQRAERLRASVSAAASRAEAAAKPKDEDEQPPIPAARSIDINDRRKAVARRLLGGRRA